MNQAEASGKTVDDALKKALNRIGARADEVEITILDEGKRGFLGRGGRDALVRVERRSNAEPEPAAIEAPDTRIPHKPAASAPRGRRGGSTGGGGRRSEGRSNRPSMDAAAPKLTAEDFLVPGAKAESRPSRGEQSSGRTRDRDRGRRNGSGNGNGNAQGASQPRRPSRPSSRSERHRDDEPHIDPDINAEEVDFAAGIVDDILRILDINAEISIREPVTPGDGLGNVLAVIDIMGDDLGLLIGRRGETPLSLQYLVNLIAGRRYPGRGGVTIDVEHYRHRREEQLISLAQRMAERVKETGAPITLEPMTPAERRLVHIAFVDDDEVETNSVGEGDHRKVVISLKERR